MSVKEKKKIHVNFCTIPATKTTRERQQKQVKRQYHKDGTNKRTSLNKNKKNKKENYLIVFLVVCCWVIFLQKNESKIDLCNFGVCMRMCGVFWFFVLGTFYLLTVIKFYVLCFIMFFYFLFCISLFFSYVFALHHPPPFTHFVLKFMVG